MLPETVLGWGGQEWQGAAETVLALAAVVGGISGLRSYRRATRTREAEWLDRLYERFYLNESFSPVLMSFEFEYRRHTRALMERMLWTPDVDLGDEEDERGASEVTRMRRIDQVLNFMEHLLYMTDEGHLRAGDRDAMFGYWLGLLRKPEYAVLRQYAHRYDYQRVSRYSGIPEVDTLFLYGSLMRGQPAHVEQGVADGLGFVGDACVQGRLHDLGEYPGLVLGKGGSVHGELYRIRDAGALERLDAYEEFVPEHPETSEYVRRLVHLPKQGIDAWVYEYQRDVGAAPVIADGRWPPMVKASPGTM